MDILNTDLLKHMSGIGFFRIKEMCQLLFCHTDTVIFYGDPQDGRGVFRFRTDADTNGTGGMFWLDPVKDCVFHKRLQGKFQDLAGEQIFVGSIDDQ